MHCACQTRWFTEDVLDVLQLGRYIFDMTTFDRRKTQDPVKIGETLDMTPFTAAKGGDQECEYELISAMIHRGSAHSGHYYALVKVSHAVT